MLQKYNLNFEELRENRISPELLNEHRRFPKEMREVYEGVIAAESRYHGQSGDFVITAFIQDVFAATVTWPFRKLVHLAKKVSPWSYQEFVANDKELASALSLRAQLIDAGNRIGNPPSDLRPALRGEPGAQLNLFRVALSVSSRLLAPGIYNRLADICLYFDVVQRNTESNAKLKYKSFKATPALVTALKESKIEYLELAKECLRKAEAIESENLARERSRKSRESAHEANMKNLQRKLDALKD